MKKLVGLLLLILPFMGWSEGKSKPEKAKKLVWADEFEYSGRPDSLKWGYETGFVRNREAQYYTRERLQITVLWRFALPSTLSHRPLQ